MTDLLDIVYIVISSLIIFAPFWWLIGSVIVCACAVLTIRLINWR